MVSWSDSPVVIGQSVPAPTTLLAKTISVASRARRQSSGVRNSPRRRLPLPGTKRGSSRRGQHHGACLAAATSAHRAHRFIRSLGQPQRRWTRRGAGSGGSAADTKVEPDRQVSLAQGVPGVGEGLGFDALVHGVQVG